MRLKPRVGSIPTRATPAGADGAVLSSREPAHLDAGPPLEPFPGQIWVPGLSDGGAAGTLDDGGAPGRALGDERQVPPERDVGLLYVVDEAGDHHIHRQLARLEELLGGKGRVAGARGGLVLVAEVL